MAISPDEKGSGMDGGVEAWQGNAWRWMKRDHGVASCGELLARKESDDIIQ